VHQLIEVLIFKPLNIKNYRIPHFLGERFVCKSVFLLVGAILFDESIRNSAIRYKSSSQPFWLVPNRPVGRDVMFGMRNAHVLENGFWKAST
jgi:hypothetical protein